MSPKLRRLLHVAVAGVLYYSGALALWRWYRRRLLGRDEVCVLGLHRVLTATEEQRSNSLEGMIIRDNTYLALLEYLERKFQVLSLDAFLARANQEAVTSKPSCLVTFDDGWEDTYSRAFPGLRKYGLPAVVFLATGSIGTQGGFWVERVKHAWRISSIPDALRSALKGQGALVHNGDAGLEEIVECLKRMPTNRRDAILQRILPPVEFDGSKQLDSMMTWEQAQEMSRVGVEMGAHTVSHPLLSYEEPASVECELRLSKQMVEEKLGKPARAFAYPNGDWNDRVSKQVEQTGYRCAFTTHPAWHDSRENQFTISRVLLHEGNITTQDGKFSPAMLNLALAGWA